MFMGLVPKTLRVGVQMAVNIGLFRMLVAAETSSSSRRSLLLIY
jgi:hypothetical protein